MTATTLVGKYFQHRSHAELGRDGKPIPYHGAPTIVDMEEEDEELNANEDTATNGKKKRQRRAKRSPATMTNEEEVSALAPRLAAASNAAAAAAVASSSASASAPVVPLLSTSSPSPPPSSAPNLSYRLPDWSGFHRHATQKASTYTALPMPPTTTAISNIPTKATVPATPADAVEPAPIKTTTTTTKKKKAKKGSKRKAVEEVEEVVPSTAPAASAGAAAARAPNPSESSPLVLPSHHQYPPLPRRDTFFATHWIRHRSSIELESLMPFVAPKYSLVIPTEKDESTTVSATAAKSPVKKAKAGQATSSIQVATGAPPSAIDVAAQSHDPAVNQPTEPTSPVPPPSRTAKHLKVTKGKAKGLTPAAAPPSASSTQSRLTKADYDFAEATLKESSIKSLKLIALSIGLIESLSAVRDEEFADRLNDANWRAKFKQALLQYWSNVEP